MYYLQCIEKKKVGEWSAKVEKIEKVGRKKDEFAVQTKEALEAKMNAAEMNRETMIAYLMEKLKVSSYKFHIFLFTVNSHNNFRS